MSWRCCFDDGRSRGDQLPQVAACVLSVVGEAQGAEMQQATRAAGRVVRCGKLRGAWCVAWAQVGCRATAQGGALRWGCVLQVGVVRSFAGLSWEPWEEEVLPGLWSVPVARLAGTGRGRGGPHVSLSVRARVCFGFSTKPREGEQGGMAAAAAAAVHMSYRPGPSDRRGRLIG